MTAGRLAFNRGELVSGVLRLKWTCFGLKSIRSGGWGFWLFEIWDGVGDVEYGYQKMADGCPCLLRSSKEAKHLLTSVAQTRSRAHLSANDIGSSLIRREVPILRSACGTNRAFHCRLIGVANLSASTSSMTSI